MNLHLQNKTFCVGGATSGLGRAITERLLAEGATVVGVARGQAALDAMTVEYPNFRPHAADLSDPAAVDRLAERLLGEDDLTGCVLNAGGPPPGRIAELGMDDWDRAYATTLRWKIQLTQALLPALSRPGGRLLFVESVSIKQPIDNLVLSNALRAAVAGFVKTLSREAGRSGLTANIIAPGYHATPRITAVLEKAAEIQDQTLEEATADFAAEVPTGSLGDPADLAALAAYLLSPQGRYVNGQTITVDGGLTRHLTG